MTITKLQVLEKMKEEFISNTYQEGQRCFLCHIAYRVIADIMGISKAHASNTQIYKEITEAITSRISGKQTVETYVNTYIGGAEAYPDQWEGWVDSLRLRILDEMIEDERKPKVVEPEANSNIHVALLEAAKVYLQGKPAFPFLCTAVEAVGFSQFGSFSDNSAIKEIKVKIEEEIEGCGVYENYFIDIYGFNPSVDQMKAARQHLADKLIKYFKENK